MTLPSFGRRNITILASVLLLATCLFGWVGIGHMQKQWHAQTPISKSPAFRNETKDRPAVGEGRIMYSNGASISVISADPNDQQNSYTVASSFFLNNNSSPTVSLQTGKIAYLSNRRSENVNVDLVWAMDADGANPHQVTPPLGLLPGAQDSLPAISPDGTKIAFIARRFNDATYPDGTPINAEVFVVNFDGSALHQVTKSDRAANGGTTSASAVAWGSSGLYVSGRRVVTDAKTGDRVTKTGIFTFSSGSSTEDGNLVTELPNLSEPNTMDVSGGTILFARDNILFVGSGELATYTQILSEDAGSPRWSAGGVRFSPNGSRIVYSSDDDGGSIKTIGSAGGGWVEVKGNLGNTNSKWWMPGSMPTPARLEMSPSMVFLPNDGTVQQMTPTLYDTNNNVIFHAATFNFICDVSHPCFNGVDGRQFTFFQDGQLQIGTVGETRIGATNFCGTNGGITGCSVVSIGVPNFAEIRGSVPSTNTNGAGGPAIFTVRRQSNSANNAFNVDFTLGGTAVRDIDYVLNVVGNSITFQGRQTTYDISVTPLTTAGDKTVTISITAPPGSSYFTLPGRDTASVNIIDNGTASTVLSLSSITPASGGNGGVVVSKVFGDNIAKGAAVKLTRAGEPDLPGANVNVASGGKSLTTVFDLNGRATGQWNVVVTNPDSTIDKLTNGFTVEANVDPRLTVQVSGASTIRASHTRSRYDVVYTNHGNTDAFGVVLFVTGVAANECVDENDGDCTFLETRLTNVSDIPGQDPFPAWVRQVPNVVPTDLPNVSGPGLRHVGAIPVLIPRIPAHGTGTFRFSMRFTVISESNLQKINAAILPPLVRAVTVPGAAKPTVRMQVIGPADADSDKNCIDSIFVNAINCALSLIPGQACLAAGVGAITTVAQIAGNTSIQGDKAINPVSGSQMYAAGVSVMTCLKQATPIGELLNIIGCLAGFLDSCSTCLGPDACNPFNVAFVQSADPNEKTGVRRFTSQNFVQNSNLLYSISFENQASATAPAQDVIVTDQLDTSTLDLDTFELGSVSFGDTTIDIPARLKTYSTEIDLRPSKDLLVDVSANLDGNTGLVTWTFHCIDPFTRQAPTDALAGFLPPNVLGTEGVGKVLFTISPKSLLASGTEIRNRARITFDLNPPIDTNEWINTIDDSKPASDVAALPSTERDVTFPVTWSGSDSGSGIADYSVFVSDNGGTPIEWLINTSDTTAMFTGLRGHTYSFYSVALDNAANLEAPPAVPDTTTLILAPTAAGVEVSGRISTPAGLAVSNARVSIADLFGVTRTVVTNPFGYYRFDDVRAGRAYVISVRAKQHQFASRALELNDNLVGLDFVSLE